MRRRKCAILLAVVLAAGLLPARMAIAADGSPQHPSNSGERWDDGPSLAGGPMGEFSQGGPGDFGPPPRDDDHPLPPPRDKRGPDGDRPHPPRGTFEGRPGGPPPADHAAGPFDQGPGHFPPGPPHFGDIESLKKIDPEMYKVLKEDQDLEHQTRELVMQYRRAPSDQRDKLKAQVEELVNKHFEVRQQRRSLELKRLEGELQRLREAIDRRSKARKEIVEKRVSELIGREDELRF